MEVKEIQMNKETIITAVVALVVAIFNLLKVFGTDIAVDNNTIYVIVDLIVSGVFYWRNQSWTNGGWIGTQVGRKIKEDEAKGDLRFHDEIKRLLEERE